MLGMLGGEFWNLSLTMLTRATSSNSSISNPKPSRSCQSIPPRLARSSERPVQLSSSNLAEIVQFPQRGVPGSDFLVPVAGPKPSGPLDPADSS